MTGSWFNQMSQSDDGVRQELETIMPVIAWTLVQAIGTDSCAFYVYDETASRTVAAFRYGFSHVVFPAALADYDNISPQTIPIESELLRTRRTIRRFTEDDFRRWPMQNEVLRERAQRYSDIAVPLVWNDEVVGVVYLWRRGSTLPFNDEEIAVAEDLAQVAAMAVVFARRYGQERTLRQRLDALLNVASIAASARTVDEILPHVTQAVRSSTGADVCDLYVFDESGDQVVDVYSDGLDESERWVFSRSERYRVSDIPVEARLRGTLEPAVVTDPQVDLAPGSALAQHVTESGIREILVVPIVYLREMIGVIYAWYRDTRQSFSRDAIQTVQAIANQAGGVISRARLDEASRQHIQETEALLRIGRAVLTSDTLDAVLDEIADVLAAMLAHDYAYVAMLDDNGDSLIVTRAWGEFPGEVLLHEIPVDGSLTSSAVTSGELINVGDAHADSRSFLFQQQYLPIRSAMIAPLITEHGVIGALYLGSNTGGGFSERQERLMSLLSQQAAVAIERTEARNTLAGRARRQTLLATVADRLASADDLDDALEEVAASACGVLADGVMIALASWEYGTIEWSGAAMADTGRPSELTGILREMDLSAYRDKIEQLLLSESSITMSIDECPWLLPESQISGPALGITQVLIVPMRSQGRAPGLLCLLSTQAGEGFHRDVVETTQLVASRIADEVERRQMSANRAALLRSSEAMNRRSDLAELVKLIADELNEIIPYDSLYIGELDREVGVTRQLYFFNPLGHPVEEVELASNEGLCGKAMREHVFVFENQAHLHPSSAYASEREAELYATYGESVMAAPMIAQGVAVGIIFMGRIGEHRFNASDFETFKVFAGLAASAIHRAMLLERNQSTYRASVEVLAAAVDARDPTAHQHSRNVAYYGKTCAELYGLAPDCVERVELAGLLHDIGKLGIPDSILAYADLLDPGGQRMIEDHPVRAAAILSQHPSLGSLAPLVRHHHERYDGHGYPDKLAGDEVPVGAAIIQVADAFDSMLAAYSDWSWVRVEDVLEKLAAGAGTQFHPRITQTFLRGVRSGQISLSGSTVSTASLAAVRSLADVDLDEAHAYRSG